MRSTHAPEPQKRKTDAHLAPRRHAQAYVTTLNNALDKFPEMKSLGLVDLNKAVGTDKLPTVRAAAVPLPCPPALPLALLVASMCALGRRC